MKGMLRALCVLWPSFLAACALEMLVFGLVDPGDLHWPVAGIRDVERDCFEPRVQLDLALCRNDFTRDHDPFLLFKQP